MTKRKISGMKGSLLSSEINLLSNFQKKVFRLVTQQQSSNLHTNDSKNTLNAVVSKIVAKTAFNTVDSQADDHKRRDLLQDFVPFIHRQLRR